LWTLAATAGSYLSTMGGLTRTLTFSGFEGLIGGAAEDTFTVTQGETFQGDIDGGAGRDILTYAGYDVLHPVVVDLATDATTTDGISGAATGISGAFTNMDALVGAGNVDDTLNGADHKRPSNLAQAHATISTRSGTTSSSQALRSSTAAIWMIHFAFVPGVVPFVGIINGGDGSDTLTYAAYTDARIQVTLTADSTPDGFDGSAPSWRTSLASITSSAAAMPCWTTPCRHGPGCDIRDRHGCLSLPPRATGSADNVAEFSGFENLTGGTQTDTFKFFDTATFIGDVDGGAGTDWLDYTQYDCR